VGSTSVSKLPLSNRNKLGLPLFCHSQRFRTSEESDAILNVCHSRVPVSGIHIFNSSSCLSGILSGEHWRSPRRRRKLRFRASEESTSILSFPNVFIGNPAFRRINHPTHVRPFESPFLATSRNTLRVCHSQRFRASEESDALAYLLDVNPVPLISQIKVHKGDLFFQPLPLIFPLPLGNECERASIRLSSADCTEANPVPLERNSNQNRH
jgi:hypothetical protein